MVRKKCPSCERECWDKTKCKKEKGRTECNLGSTQVKNKGALKMLTRIETLTLFNK